MTSGATGEQALLRICVSADAQGESICSAEPAGGYTSEIVPARPVSLSNIWWSCKSVPKQGIVK